jgi:hypothetical protein
MKNYLAIILLLNNALSHQWKTSQNNPCHNHYFIHEAENELYQPGPNYVDCFRHTHLVQEKPDKMAWGGHAYSNYGYVSKNFADNVYGAKLFEKDYLPLDYQQNHFGVPREGYQSKGGYGNLGVTVGLDGLNRNILQDRYYTDNRLNRYRFNKPAGYYFNDLYYDPDVYTSYGHHSQQP